MTRETKIGLLVGLAALSVVARLATYLGTALAVPVLRIKFPDAPGVIRIPGGWLIPAAAAVLCMILAASAEPRNLIAGAIALAVGFVIAQDKRIRDLERRVNAISGEQLNHEDTKPRSG